MIGWNEKIVIFSTTRQTLSISSHHWIMNNSHCQWLLCWWWRRGGEGRKNNTTNINIWLKVCRCVELKMRFYNVVGIGMDIYFVGRLDGWLDGWLVVWLFNGDLIQVEILEVKDFNLAGCLAAWLVGQLVSWLVGWLGWWLFLFADLVAMKKNCCQSGSGL